MSTIRVRFHSQEDDRCMLLGAESLDPYTVQSIAEDLRRNTHPGLSLDIDVPHGSAPRELDTLVAALREEGLRLRVTDDRVHPG